MVKGNRCSSTIKHKGTGGGKSGTSACRFRGRLILVTVTSNIYLFLFYSTPSGVENCIITHCTSLREQQLKQRWRLYIRVRTRTYNFRHYLIVHDILEL